MTMLWTGVIALLLIFVTYCSGLSCYKCSYEITVEGSGPPAVSGDKSCGGDDTSKYQTQDCPAEQKVCFTQHWAKATTSFNTGANMNTTGVSRGCSDDQELGCAGSSINLPGDVERLTICKCNSDKCNSNGQTRIVPAILTYTIAIGFLLF